MTDNERYLFEAITAKLDLNNKRLFIALIISIVLLVGTNLAWVFYENSYSDYVSIETEQEGNLNYINNIAGGDINGQTESENN